MTKEEIVRLTREAGMTFILGQPHEAMVQQLQRFAALVAKREREECAKLCEEHIKWPSLGPKDCAHAIRERNQE